MFDATLVYSIAKNLAPFAHDLGALFAIIGATLGVTVLSLYVIGQVKARALLEQFKSVGTTHSAAQANDAWLNFDIDIDLSQLTAFASATQGNVEALEQWLAVAFVQRKTVNGQAHTLSHTIPSNPTPDQIDAHYATSDLLEHISPHVRLLPTLDTMSDNSRRVENFTTATEIPDTDSDQPKISSHVKNCTSIALAGRSENAPQSSRDLFWIRKREAKIWEDMNNNTMPRESAEAELYFLERQRIRALARC